MEAPNWQPTHFLQSRETEFGFIGSSGEQRVRELARNDTAIPKELVGKVEKKREGKYEYFRYRAQLTPIQAAAERCRTVRRGIIIRTSIGCMKKSFGITIAMGECDDCSWKYHGKDALGLAAIHAKSRKHKVFATHEVGGYYDARVTHQRKGV